MSSGEDDSSSTTKKTKSGWKPSYDYEVNYNDHFETPLCAYQDIAPILDMIGDNDNTYNNTTKKTRQTLRLYDPYYCNGKVSTLLQQLGYKNIIHSKRDFYKDVQNNQVPTHDVFITNPPYSDQHKEKCLQICIDSWKTHRIPFFILMPNYVASRSYYQQIVGNGSIMKDIAYVLPKTPYEYEHPEGTGHDIPPFMSLWFCGIGKDLIDQVQENWDRNWKFCNGEKPQFFTSLEQLQIAKAIPTEKRPNPGQRKRRRKQKMMQLLEAANNNNHNNEQAGDDEDDDDDNINNDNNIGKFTIEKKKKQKSKKPNNNEKIEIVKRKTTKRSRYRDESGKRTKKRF